jgi:hypothetical protein
MSDRTLVLARELVRADTILEQVHEAAAVEHWLRYRELVVDRRYRLLRQDIASCLHDQKQAVSNP